MQVTKSFGVTFTHTRRIVMAGKLMKIKEDTSYVADPPHHKKIRLSPGQSQDCPGALWSFMSPKSSGRLCRG
jgi:hypothetical protein